MMLVYGIRIKNGDYLTVNVGIYNRNGLSERKVYRLEPLKTRWGKPFLVTDKSKLEKILASNVKWWESSEDNPAIVNRSMLSEYLEIFEWEIE
jgi:hypothetical protein